MTDKEYIVRLNQYIASAGICSRRKADDLIKEKKIKVNNIVVHKLGAKINVKKDVVKYKDIILTPEKKIFLILNKPKGYISAVSDKNNRTIIDIIKNSNIKERLYPIGRLDKDTTGLIILTNDGDLSKKLSHPSSNISKQYIVNIDKPISEKDFNTLVKGVVIDNIISKLDNVEIIPTKDYGKSLLIRIHSGRNRIIRKTFEKLGYKVNSLDRNKYAGIGKKNVPRGKWRNLTEREIGYLKML